MHSLMQQIKTTQSLYDYPMVIAFIQSKGIELFGKKFLLLDSDSMIILKLSIYFLKDEVLAETYQVDLFKGIMLSGPVGCGKTSLMFIMKYLLNNDSNFTIKSVRDIASDFSRDGYDTLLKYTRLSFNSYNNRPITFCFDDVGLEPTVQYYGNQCNTMSEILLSRYDYFQQQHMLTHITTNLSASEIQERYGIRVRSRMRELFNLIAFDKSTADKRK